MRPLMTYLHQQHFNVYAPPGAGHAFHRSRLPETRIRQQYGYDDARQLLLQDPVVKAYLDKIQLLAAMSPPDRVEYDETIARVKNVLKNGLNQTKYDHIISTLQLLTPTEYTPGFEQKLVRFCETDHTRYASHSMERLADVCALPGPVYVVGYSLGGVQALNLTAGSKMIDKMVLLAPYLGTIDCGDDVEVSLSALGALDLHLLPFPLSTVSACHLTAASIAARCVQSHDVVQRVKETTKCFCVISEGDDCCDPKLVQRFFEKIRTDDTFGFVYAKELGLKHGIVPGKENRFSKALLKEIWRFLVLGEVRKEWLITLEGDPDLPTVEENVLRVES